MVVVARCVGRGHGRVLLAVVDEGFAAVGADGGEIAWEEGLVWIWRGGLGEGGEMDL